MQTITLLCVGSLKQSMYKEALEFFTKRLEHYCKFNVVELPDSKQKTIEKKKEEESASIVRYLQKNTGYTIALDEHGKHLSSTEWSTVVKNSRDTGEAIICIIGGAYGFTKEVTLQCNQVIALSKCTFTHELCRLVLLEQLYRSFQILANTGYHHI